MFFQCSSFKNCCHSVIRSMPLLALLSFCYLLASCHVSRLSAPLHPQHNHTLSCALASISVCACPLALWISWSCCRQAVSIWCSSSFILLGTNLAKASIQQSQGSQHGKHLAAPSFNLDHNERQLCLDYVTYPEDLRFACLESVHCQAGEINGLVL